MGNENGDEIVKWKYSRMQVSVALGYTWVIFVELTRKSHCALMGLEKTPAAPSLKPFFPLAKEFFTYNLHRENVCILKKVRKGGCQI